MENECRDVTAYLIGELNEMDRRRFEQHMKKCLSCQEEYSQLKEAWDGLHTDIDMLEVPPSLKDDVLQFVYDHKENHLAENRFAVFSWLRTQFNPVATAFICMMAIVMIGLIIENHQLKQGLVAEEEQIREPAEVVSTWPLKAVENGNQNGTAFLVKQGNEQKLIVKVQQLPKVKDSQVYQVWLLKDGKRKNAGVFKPDELGAGVLTYTLSAEQSFENIGITIEPDPYGNEPRGEKVAGT